LVGDFLLSEWLMPACFENQLISGLGSELNQSETAQQNMKLVRKIIEKIFNVDQTPLTSSHPDL